MVSFLVSSLALMAAVGTMAVDASLLRSPVAGNATFAPPDVRRNLLVNEGYGFLISQIREDKDWCLVAAGGATNNAKLKLQRCDLEGAPSKQLWKLTEDGKLHSHLDETKCMVANFGNALFDGVRMRINDCDLVTDFNTFTLEDGTDYLTVDADPSYCITNRGPNPHPTDTIHAKPCKNRGDYKWTFQPLPSPQLLSHQATPGVCVNAGQIGCSNGDGTSGNPNDLVNCFAAPYSPFDVTHIKFWLNGALPLPESLSVRVWTGTVADGPSGPPALDQVLPSYGAGLNSVALDTPVTMSDDEFCVGVYGGATSDGFRLDTEGAMGEEVSFLLAPTCGLSSFGTMQSIGFDLAFCIEAMVAPVAA